MAHKHRMKFVSERLSMPLFVLARNSIMTNGLKGMRRYLKKQRNFYTKSCREENATETPTQRYMKDLAGFYKKTPIVYSCPHTRSTPYSRALIKSKAWQMAPNRYAVPLPIGASRKGMGGAYWRKERKIKVESMFKTKKELPMRKPHWHLYKLPSQFESIRNQCNIHKGVFVTNPRARRPTLRSMVTNPLMCYRDPDEPSPATYYPHVHELSYKKEKIFREIESNPHLFTRHTSVPEKLLSYPKRHIGFLPGPGRYESCFFNICPCSFNRIYLPGIQWIIDREKRLKFRRMKFRKMKTRAYCSPELRHVVGQGHQHLFKNIPKRHPRMQKTTKAMKARMAEKTTAPVHLYADAKYIALINTPKHKKLTERLHPLVELPKRISYHCIFKRFGRHRRINKKIAFNSGQDRFRDDEKPAILTTSAQKRAIARLPPERRLNDHPVMKRSPEEITSKLTSTPLHQQCHYELEIRKRLYKFLPLPKPKLLVTIEDVRGTPVEGSPNTKYFKKIDPTKYFKSEELRPTLASQNTD